jgi:hypothetical protein
MDIARLIALNPSIIKVFFIKISDLRALYKIENEDTYNIDEKGF